MVVARAAPYIRRACLDVRGSVYPRGLHTYFPVIRGIACFDNAASRSPWYFIAPAPSFLPTPPSSKRIFFYPSISHLGEGDRPRVRAQTSILAIGDDARFFFLLITTNLSLRDVGFR